MANPSATPGMPAGTAAPPLTTFYFALWALVLPVTSVLVVPSIQGTTLAYMLAMALLVPWLNALLLGPGLTSRFYAELATILTLFVALIAAAQLAAALSPEPDPMLINRAPMVDRKDPKWLLRDSMFTQSIYLLAGLCTFLFVKLRYTPAWDRWILAGAWVVGGYGMYEVLYFLAFGANGDFLSNRTFGEERNLSGSLFQTIRFGPIELPRLKSLTGEPSMYAFTVLPFWIYALHTGRRLTHIFLLATLALSTSATAIVGFAVYLIARVVLRRFRDHWLLLAMAVAATVLMILLIGGNEQIVKIFNTLVGNKLAGRDVSGSERLGNAAALMDLYASFSLPNQLFGVGFGYVRSTDMGSTLLVNSGVIGLLCFLALYLYPIFFLGRTEREIGLRAGLVVVLTAAMLSVPEFAYLSSWLFLGIAYQQLAINRRERAATGMRAGGPMPARAAPA
jgi:O-Antigen ligase